jgi:membrane-bound lytic murein transglycosylase B
MLTNARSGCGPLYRRLPRRRLLAAAVAAVTVPAIARAGVIREPTAPSADESFHAYIAGVKAEARRLGISQSTLDRAFANVHLNRRAIDLDRHQPEFHLTWDQYRLRIVSPARIAKGRELYAKHHALLRAIETRYGVPPGIIIGIWGLESNYGVEMGSFNVIEGLASLAWEGRREEFFRSELMDALKILEHGDIAPEQMIGSYAGAMGQTQFMPDSFLKYAVDYGGNGRRDIWNDIGDVFASTAHYLQQEGWRSDVPWGVAVQLPANLPPAALGRNNRRLTREWAALGVRRTGGHPFAGPDVQAAIVVPGDTPNEAYLVYWPNFLALRRYNPSDFYDISVGLIGDGMVA